MRPRRRSGFERIGALLDAGELSASVGDVLPLSRARRVHEMLAGAPHERGKVVLAIA
jgi:NADPH:quinone reductase-like Zn-dependent oxidoreductase